MPDDRMAMTIKKVAVVDDSQFMRRLIRAALGQVNPELEVVEFADSEEALLRLPELAPDLITLDMLMPKVNGLQFLDRLKQQPGAPPVIVITADIQKSVREKCAEHGVHGFIEKPITYEKLQTAFARLAA